MNIKEMISKLVIVHFLSSLGLVLLGYLFKFYTLDQVIAQIILLAIPFPITILMAVPSTIGLILAVIVMWATGDLRIDNTTELAISPPASVLSS